MKNEILYFECFSGISGDMTVGALLDLGADKEVLLNALDTLNVLGYKIEITRVKKCGIDACYFNVILDSPHEHTHRNITDIEKIIDTSNITQNAKGIAKKIFTLITKAEAKAHNIAYNEVHFHEVGAIDSIVDIVAVAVCIDNLGIQKVAVSTLYEGQGQVKCQHGIMPVPVPAVVNIAELADISLKITHNLGEMITPTGIAIVLALKTQKDLPDSFHIKKIGLGAGKKDFEHANIVRIMIIEEKNEDEEIWVMETNIDDSTGEALAFTLENLLSSGAKDVYFIPIFMKKNRPATMLCVICAKKDIEKLEKIIFFNLPTLGIRKHKTERSELERSTCRIKTSLGECTFKMTTFLDDVYVYPEYEDVKKICMNNTLGFDATYNKLKNEGNLKTDSNI